MIRHVVLFRFTPESTTESRQDMLAALRALPERLPEIHSYQAELDLSLRDGSWDATVVADFDDVDGWRTYVQDPEHQRIIAELIQPITAERASTQIEV